VFQSAVVLAASLYVVVVKSSNTLFRTAFDAQR
jgi:hypothetical protein